MSQPPCAARNRRLLSPPACISSPSNSRDPTPWKFLGKSGSGTSNDLSKDIIKGVFLPDAEEQPTLKEVYRERLGDEEVTADEVKAPGFIYIESLYIVTYFVILGVALNSVLLLALPNLKPFRNYGNLWAKVLYWPVIWLTLLVVTILTFYT